MHYVRYERKSELVQRSSDKSEAGDGYEGIDEWAVGVMWDKKTVTRTRSQSPSKTL